MIDIVVRYGDLIIHGDGKNFISDWELKQSRDDIDSFSFNIYPDNDYFNNVVGITDVYTSGLEVIDENGDQQFYGRCIQTSNEMDSNGLVYKNIVYEGIKGYLADTTFTLNAFTKRPLDDTDYMDCKGQAQCCMYPYDVMAASDTNGDGVIDENDVTYIDKSKATGAYDATFKAFLDKGEGVYWERIMDPSTHALMSDNTYAVPAVELVQTALAYHNYNMFRLGSEGSMFGMDCSGDWQNYIIYKSEEYDTNTLDFINSVLSEAGAEMFASYDTDTNTGKLVIADRAYTSTAGTIQLADNMISCVQDQSPDELFTSVEIFVDNVSQDKTTSDNIAWTRDWRISLGAITQAIDELGEDGGTDTGKATAWLEEVFDEFTDTQWDYKTLHKYTYENGYIFEQNAKTEYGNTHTSQLTLSGLINWSDYDGWENLLVIPSDDITGSTGYPWLKTVIYNLVTEDLYKRIARLGIAWLNERCRVVPSIDISAADMSLIKAGYADMKVGTWWAVKNDLLNLDDVLEITQVTYAENSTHIPSITLGRRPHRSVDTAVHEKKVADDTTSSDSSSSSSTTTSSSTTGASSTGGTSWRFQVVSEAPSVGVENTVYFVKPSS